MNSGIYRLITIPSSHYCEKARWALDWLKIPYIEERHVPVFHRFFTRKYDATTVPILVTNSGNFLDSSDILGYLDTQATGERRLYPKEPDLRQETEELEELFDTKLGVHTRRWAFFYRISDRQKMRRGSCEGTSWFERLGFEICFPLISKLMQKGMNVTESSAAESLLEIEQIFEIVNQRLTDGRPYLVGDSFSAADLTFATLAAPILSPPEYPIKPSSIKEVPRAMVQTIRKFRKTPPGDYALRLYREERFN